VFECEKEDLSRLLYLIQIFGVSSRILFIAEKQAERKQTQRQNKVLAKYLLRRFRDSNKEIVMLNNIHYIILSNDIKGHRC
jgi:hypothetical protein